MVFLGPTKPYYLKAAPLAAGQADLLRDVLPPAVGLPRQPASGGSKVSHSKNNGVDGRHLA